MVKVKDVTDKYELFPITVLCGLSGACRIPAVWNASFKPSGKYPVVVFSHGLGAFR